MAIPGFMPPYQVHLGCDEIKIPGFVNIDSSQNAATDLVHATPDLKPFPDNSVSLLFCQTFSKYVLPKDRADLLAEVRRVLTLDGRVYFSGLPDFEMVAKSYLARSKGHISETFDLKEASRYTEQKSLFDFNEVITSVKEAGFKSPCIFRYAFEAEANAVNLSFVARKDDKPVTKSLLTDILVKFTFAHGTNPVWILEPEKFV